MARPERLERPTLRFVGRRTEGAFDPLVASFEADDGPLVQGEPLEGGHFPSIAHSRPVGWAWDGAASRYPRPGDEGGERYGLPVL